MCLYLLEGHHLTHALLEKLLFYDKIPKKKKQTMFIHWVSEDVRIHSSLTLSSAAASFSLDSRQDLCLLPIAWLSRPSDATCISFEFIRVSAQCYLIRGLSLPYLKCQPYHSIPLTLLYFSSSTYHHLIYYIIIPLFFVSTNYNISPMIGRTLVH